MKVKPISLVYEPGFYQTSNGNKKQNLRFSEADVTWTNNNGFYKLKKNAHYYLTCEDDNGVKYDMDLKWMFGITGIKLIAKKRKWLEDNVPEYLEIYHDECLHKYMLDWDCFNKWIAGLM